jgi:hypothetical protein
VGIFSGSKDRAKATFLVIEITGIVLESCERLSNTCEKELTPKLINGAYADLDEFFAQVDPDVKYIKGLVTELVTLGSATGLIIERGSPSMRQMMIANNGELERGKDLVWDQVMRIERFMLENNLIQYSPAEGEGYWASNLIYSDFTDYSEHSLNFFFKIKSITECFL